MVKLTKEQKEYRKEYYKKNKGTFREYYQKNKEKRREQQKKWMKRNKEKVKEYSKKEREKLKGKSEKWKEWNRVRKKGYNLKKTFGITIKQYNELFQKQGGICAICGNRENGKSLAVDHNHKTGEIRELLCTNCNLTIGLLNDDPSILKKAIKYLEKWNQR